MEGENSQALRVIRRLFALSMMVAALRERTTDEYVRRVVDSIIEELDDAIADVRSSLFRQTSDFLGDPLRDTHMVDGIDEVIADVQ